VTHEDEVAAHCQRVIRLRDGQVLSDLPIDQDRAGAHRAEVESRLAARRSVQPTGGAIGEAKAC
jgi:ABC-type lipoprotein export system ATPase subunit